MVLCFTGLNSFLLHKALAQAKAAFIENNGDFALEVVEVEDWALGALLDLLSAQSFLSPYRMIVMRGLASNKEAVGDVETLLGAVSDTTTLYIVEPKIDKRSVLYKTLKKHTEFKEFAEADVHSLQRWVVGYAKENKGSISQTDAAQLVARVGSSQELLANEIDKLLLYNLAITKETIALLTEKTPQSSVFDLLEAAFNGNHVTALALYEEQRAQNVEVLAIEALFVWQLHIVLLVKAAKGLSADAVAAQSGISPYVAKKSSVLASKRQYVVLKRYTQRLAGLEYAIKTSNIDPDDAMRIFILELSMQ